MTVALALAALALRAGLALRRARRGRGRRTAAMRRAHLRMAKAAVVLVLLGFSAGPPSAVALRGWEPFHTFHGAIAALVAILFATVFALGYRLERARSRAFDTHALTGIIAVALAALAAMAGFVLLP